MSATRTSTQASTIILHATTLRRTSPRFEKKKRNRVHGRGLDHDLDMIVRGRSTGAGGEKAFAQRHGVRGIHDVDVAITTLCFHSVFL